MAQRLADAGPWVLTTAVALMLLLESRWSLVPLLPAGPRTRHVLKNASLALCALGFAIGGTFLQVTLASWATKHDVGFLHLVDAPWPLRIAFVLVVFDFLEWVRHRVHHHVPLLWRLHRVHHSDPHLDASTALRGHPLEGLLAWLYFSAFIVLLGVDPLSLAVRALLVASALAWHHSVLRVPERLDWLISLVTPTPRTHRMHHSRDVRFTDTNFGTLLTWWDRLFRTWTAPRTHPEPQTGLDGFDTPRHQSLGGLLRLPFERAALSRDPASR